MFHGETGPAWERGHWRNFYLFIYQSTTEKYPAA
jgi:hypothetical protein